MIGQETALKQQLRQALNSSEPKKVEEFFETADKEGLTSTELQELLTSTNSDGLTPLHEAVGSGSIDVLQSFVGEIQCAFNGYQTADDHFESDKSDEIIRQLCNESGEGCAEINDYLEYLRVAYPKVELHASVRPGFLVQGIIKSGCLTLNCQEL